MEARDFVLFSKEYRKNPNPYSLSEKSSDFVDVVHLQDFETWCR